MGQALATKHNEEALALGQKLEGLLRRKEGNEGQNYATVLHNEGMLLHNLGRYREAVEKLNASLAIRLRKNDPAAVLRSSAILTASLAMLDRRAEASAVGERALMIGSEAFGPDDARLTGMLSSLGGLKRDQEDYGEAERYFARALAILQKSPNASPPELASAMDDLGNLYGLEGRFEDGERLLKQALALIDRAYGANASAVPNYDTILINLGNLYKDAGRLPEAEAMLNRALAVARANHGENHPTVAGTMGYLAIVLEQESRSPKPRTSARRRW
jgi:tetratricopeptide (TPR) repeat protein